MPRVQTYDTQQVQSRPVGTPFSNLNTDTGMQTLAQGAEQLGAGVGDLQQTLERVKQKADTVAVTNAETAYQHEITSALNGNAEKQQSGFLSMRGQDAAAGSAKTLETLEAARQKIADGLTNNEQKKLFTMRAGGLYEDARRTVESHVSRQVQEAEVASVAARREAALTSIANNYADPATVARQMVAMEGPIRALSLSKEDADAKVAEFQRDAAKVRLNQFLASKNYKGAETLFSQVKDTLGQEAPQFQNVISTLKQKQEGDRLALSTIAASTNEGGLVDTDKAIAAFNKLPEGQRTEEAQAAFARQLGMAREASTATTADFFDKALTAFNKHHSIHDIDPKVEQWVRQYDPKGWADIENRQQSWIDRWKTNAREKFNLPPTPAQTAAYGQFLTDLADNQQEFGKMSYPVFQRQYGTTLAPKDFEKAQAHFADAHETAAKPLPNDQSAIAQAAGMFRTAFKLPDDKAKWTQQNWTLFNDVIDHVQQQDRAFRKAHPKEAPTAETIGGWVNERLASGNVLDTGTFSDDTVTRAEFERNPEYTGKSFAEEGVPNLKDVPDEVSGALGRIIEQRGGRVSDQSKLDALAQVVRGIRSSGGTPDIQTISQFLMQHAPPEKPRSTNPAAAAFLAPMAR